MADPDGSAAMAERASAPTRRPGWLGGWLDLLFPPRCAGCRRRGAWLCATCLTRLEPPPAPCCPRCGDPVSRAGLCTGCRAVPPAFDRAWSPYRFAEPLRPAIHRFKYEGEHAFGGVLGRLLAEAVRAEGFDFDLVAPVPLHDARLRQRGYNQSEILARALAACGRPLTTDLKRVRATAPQVGKNREEPRTNVAGAFAWQGPALTGRRILLVDDVCTTGATLDACAQALRPHAPAGIVAVTLARG